MPRSAATAQPAEAGRARKDGREAITHYRVLEARFGAEGWDITRIACELETGRTHQIRVHMAHIGHPLVADPAYAARLRHQDQPLLGEPARSHAADFLGARRCTPPNSASNTR